MIDRVDIGGLAGDAVEHDVAVARESNGAVAEPLKPRVPAGSEASGTLGQPLDGVERILLDLPCG